MSTSNLARFAFSSLTILLAISQATRAQTASQSPQNTGPSQPQQLPLSGRTEQPGSVTAVQSVTNAGGGNSVNLINSTVNVQGAYSGSIPEGKASGILALSFPAALQLGMRNNLGPVSQNINVTQAEAQRRIARSTLLPSVNTVVSETVEQINLRTEGVLEPSFPLVAGPFNFFDARAARLDQSVFDLVRIRNLHAASENVTASRETVKDARDLIVLAVGGSYLQLIASNARIQAAEAQVESSRAVYQQAFDRLNHGLNARIDVTRTRVQLQSDQQRLRALQADRDRQKLDLARVIGLPLGQQYAVADNFAYRPVTSWVLDTALRHAYQYRADYQAAQTAIRAAETVVSAARAERLPTLRLNADYGAAGLRPDYEDHGVFTVSGTLLIPLYEGGRIRGDIDRAEAGLKQRKAELEDLRGRIDQDVRRAFIDLDAAADQVTVAQSNVDLAAETLVQARDRFVAGVADTVEVVQAQQSVIQADNDYINAVFEHNLAKVSLARAMGNAEQTVKQLLEAK